MEQTAALMQAGHKPGANTHMAPNEKVTTTSPPLPSSSCLQPPTLVTSHLAASLTSLTQPLQNGGPTFMSIVSTQFSTFESRTKSFRGWPHSSVMRPLATAAILASQGFYFSPNDHFKDRVLCAFCNLELAEWGPKDDPIREHSVRSSHCPVVTGMVLAMQARDPTQLEEIIAEEEEAVAKLQVLQMGMQKQLQQYTEQIEKDRERRDELDQRLAMFRPRGRTMKDD